VNTALTDTPATDCSADPTAVPEVDPLMISKYSLDEPTPDEAQAEWWRFYQIPQGEIDPGGKHIEQFVACFDAVIRGFDPDPLALRARVAAELSVHPERIVISYFG
jgi:hypothetical protein